VSKKHPAKQPQSDDIRNAGEAAADPAVEEPVDAGEEALCEYDAQGVAGDQAGSQIDDLRAELEEAKDRALRAQAELENYRKRAARQIEDERRYANVSLIRDLLPVWDNIGRAIEAAEKAHQTASLLEGFKMVAGQLEGVLARHRCTRINALHKPFDPNLHEAVSQQPSDSHPAGTVLMVTQAGFRLDDRVVRPSRVVVAAALPEQDAPAAETAREQAEADQPEECENQEEQPES